MNDKRRVLISVSDKSSVVDFAKALEELGWDIISTQGTGKLLRDNGVKVTTISELTGFPEILNGRVKSLHPKIHAGLLAKRTEQHMEELREQYIEPFDIAAINLYPFEDIISKDHKFEEAIEHIDIGGPTMIRAAAKNFEYVAVIVDPADYGKVVQEVREKGEVSRETKYELARKAFAHTARYDSIISSYLNRKAGILFPDTLNLSFKKKQDLRYGENPHQKAAYYINTKEGLASAEQLNGKQLSFNNILDSTTAVEIAREFDEACCVIVKHTNPCGVALGKDIGEAYEKALATDPISSFGGIVAVNRAVDEALASKLTEMFYEIIIAPEYSEGALEILRKKKNLRVLRMPIRKSSEAYADIKKVDSGILVQEKEAHELTEKDLKAVTKRKPAKEEIRDMLFAWKVVKHVKSNAIVFAKNQQTLGIGAGQMSRVDSTLLAIKKADQAKLSLAECVMASDAFFPFRDNVDHAAQAGVTAIIQPGGSIRDQESIDAANEHNIAMVFTGVRTFRH